MQGDEAPRGPTFGDCFLTGSFRLVGRTTAAIQPRQVVYCGSNLQKKQSPNIGPQGAFSPCIKLRPSGPLAAFQVILFGTLSLYGTVHDAHPFSLRVLQNLVERPVVIECSLRLMPDGRIGVWI